MSDMSSPTSARGRLTMNAQRARQCNRGDAIVPSARAGGSGRGGGAPRCGIVEEVERPGDERQPDGGAGGGPGHVLRVLGAREGVVVRLRLGRGQPDQAALRLEVTRLGGAE